MPYRYRCEQCRTTAPTTYSRRAAAAARQDHRDQFHGGHCPDGERLEHVHRWADFDYASVVKVFAALGGLVIADWLWRHF